MTATLKTNLIEPSTGTTLTMGATGQNVVIADSIKSNTIHSYNNRKNTCKQNIYRFWR